MQKGRRLCCCALILSGWDWEGEGEISTSEGEGEHGGFTVLAPNCDRMAPNRDRMLVILSMVFHMSKGTFGSLDMA